MEKRHIVLDTETTGLDVEKGHRIIEIGGVVMNGRKKTAETFHVYVNPQREIDKEAQEVHGISNEDLKDKPIFSEIAEDLLEFIDGSTLVIHNADFDVGFLDAEFKIASSTYPSISEICEVKDTLAIARNKFPGQRNSLDALSKRFDINGYDRSYHGALIDSKILGEVYLSMTGGQTDLNFSSGISKKIEHETKASLSSSLIKISASAEENLAHQNYLKSIHEDNN